MAQEIEIPTKYRQIEFKFTQKTETPYFLYILKRELIINSWEPMKNQFGKKYKRMPTDYFPEQFMNLLKIKNDILLGF